jgi:hypothetical protein
MEGQRVRAKRIARSATAVLATVAAAVMVVAPLVAEAQTAPRAGSYRPGPDATGNNTYIGRIEAPRPTGLRLGADLLVAGWFVDTTAAGWAGADKGEVWLGNMGQGTKLADLSTGQARADIRDALGAPDWTNSGFSGTIPASTLSQVQAGNQTLNVYLHTPNKGWWFKSAVVNIPSTVGLQFPNDPVVYFVQPQQNVVVDQFAQPRSRYSLRGVALDRNQVTDPNTQTPGVENSGVDRVQIYLDGPRGQGQFLGNAGLGAELLVNNLTGPANSREEGAGPQNTGGTSNNLSFIASGFGEQFRLAAFSLGWNPTTVAGGRHTVWAYARSSITGKENSTSVTFDLQRIHCNPAGQPCQ